MKTISLAKRLTEIGMTADQLADEIGVKRVTMKQNYMRGQRPSAPVAKVMAQVLGVGLADLFYPEELEQMGLKGVSGLGGDAA